MGKIIQISKEIIILLVILIILEITRPIIQMIIRKL